MSGVDIYPRLSDTVEITYGLNARLTLDDSTTVRYDARIANCKGVDVAGELVDGPLTIDLETAQILKSDGELSIDNSIGNAGTYYLYLASSKALYGSGLYVSDVPSEIGGYILEYYRCIGVVETGATSVLSIYDAESALYRRGCEVHAISCYPVSGSLGGDYSVQQQIYNYYRFTSADTARIGGVTAPIRAGLYTLTVYGSTGPDRGVVDIYVGGEDTGESMDWYAADYAYAVAKSAEILVDSPGVHELELRVDGKNASSTGYYFVFSNIALS